jgi:endonuclease/exonuclease/phosphatase family metal-dependent hydrolase
MKSLCLFVSLLWSPCIVAADDPMGPDAGLPIISWQDAAKHMDEVVVVQGRVIGARNIGKITFLNFDAAKGFTAVIQEKSYKNFTIPPEKTYNQKLVRVRGLISEYRNKPQIEITSPDQIRIVDEKDAAPIAPPPAAKHDFTGVATLATLNTLNLFDSYDDPYTADEGTPAKPKAELEHLAALIHKVDADVLALEEVENRGYVERFNAAMLGDMGYREVVCYDSNDKRGIDCAILSRFPVGPVTSYRHCEFSDGSGGMIRFQRDLLRARIEPPNAPSFELFVVHFKSKRGDSGSSDRIRLAEATETRRIMDQILKEKPGTLFAICGDFNDTFESAALKALRGTGDTGLTDFVKDLPDKAVTFNKDPHRNMIDFVFASPALARMYVPKSYKSMTSSVEQGGSDHNPVSLQIKLR